MIVKTNERGNERMRVKSVFAALGLAAAVVLSGCTLDETIVPEGISLAEFNAIKTDMSYEEVVAIVGGSGIVTSETGKAGGEDYTVMYSFEGEKQGGYGNPNASLMFQGNKLYMKAQSGLER